jgi:hypothetical protein
MTTTARRLAASFIAAATLLLSGCFVSPGSFTSAIDLRKDGRFSYAYNGEIYLLGLSKLAELGSKAKDAEPFKALPCYTDDAAADERECSKDELAKQKAEWEENRQADEAKNKRDAEMMKVMLGGIDPSSPKAAEELADRLRRQAGWKSVVYKGDGLFVVDFAISGHLDYDFQFPTMERFPMANAFVVLNKRADGAVRMDAPAFGQPGQGNPMANMGQLAAMGAALGSKDKDDGAMKLPELNGTLVLTTDGTILANNTDEGPVAGTTGQRLEWKVTPRTTAAPTALVRLGG